MEDSDPAIDDGGGRTDQPLWWGDPDDGKKPPLSLVGRVFQPARDVFAQRYATSSLVGAASVTVAATALVLSVASFWGTVQSSAGHDKQMKEFGGYLDTMLSAISSGDPRASAYFNDVAKAEILRAAKFPTDGIDDEVMLNKAMAKLYRHTTGAQLQSLNRPEARVVISQGQVTGLSGQVEELTSVTFGISPAGATAAEALVVPISKTGDPARPFTVDSAQILTAGVQELSSPKPLSGQSFSGSVRDRRNPAGPRP